MKSINVALFLAALYCCGRVDGVLDERIKIHSSPFSSVTGEDLVIDLHGTVSVNRSDVNTTSTTTDYIDEYDTLDPFEHLSVHQAPGISARVYATGSLAITSYPYMVAISSTVLWSTGTKLCSGVLITAEYVVTSAFCVYDALVITVRVGHADPTMGAAVTGTAIVNPRYYITTQKQFSNIALVKLATAQTLTTSINTINIAYKYNTDEARDVTGRSVLVLGYGIAASGGMAQLSSATMPVMSPTVCLREFSSTTITVRPAPDQSCLSTESGTIGLCTHQDVGGAVVYKFDSDSAATLAGVTSYFAACASTTPNMFTRIGPHWDWIRKYVPVYKNIG